MIRIHLWLLVNLSVVGLMLVKKGLFMTPLWTIFVFSSLILESKEQIKKRYCTPLSMWFIVGTFSLIGLLLIGAVTGINFRANQWLEEHGIVQYIIILLIGSLVIISYVRVVSSKMKEIRSQQIPSDTNPEKNYEREQGE